jgi:hypothetical protein
MIGETQLFGPSGRTSLERFSGLPFSGVLMLLGCRTFSLHRPCCFQSCKVHLQEECVAYQSGY